MSYDLAEPVALPVRNQRSTWSPTYDNYGGEPQSNPTSPPVGVGWGEQTVDEMCIGFLHLTRDGQHLENRSARKSFRPAEPTPSPVPATR